MCGRRLLLALVLATALAAVSGTGNFSTVLNGTQTSGSPPPSPPSPPAIQVGQRWWHHGRVPGSSCFDAPGPTPRAFGSP